MIAIVNVSTSKPVDGVFGEQEYEISINDKLICKFTHFREEDLAICLRRAALAVEENAMRNMININDMKPEPNQYVRIRTVHGYEDKATFITCSNGDYFWEGDTDVDDVDTTWQKGEVTHWRSYPLGKL